MTAVSPAVSAATPLAILDMFLALVEELLHDLSLSRSCACWTHHSLDVLLLLLLLPLLLLRMHHHNNCCCH
jgi:hypothetical protein